MSNRIPRALKGLFNGFVAIVATMLLPWYTAVGIFMVMAIVIILMDEDVVWLALWCWIVAITAAVLGYLYTPNLPEAFVPAFGALFVCGLSGHWTE